MCFCRLLAVRNKNLSFFLFAWRPWTILFLLSCFSSLLPFTASPGSLHLLQVVFVLYEDCITYIDASCMWWKWTGITRTIFYFILYLSVYWIVCMCSGSVSIAWMLPCFVRILVSRYWVYFSSAFLHKTMLWLTSTVSPRICNWVFLAGI